MTTPTPGPLVKKWAAKSLLMPVEMPPYVGVYLAADVDRVLDQVMDLLDRVPGHTECVDCQSEAQRLLATLKGRTA